mmetsp:Transcript_19138/g.34903  ORF Transcript_19138/g.34903 Transcript_19138/m.34903 type:complete len:326 (-) Transcript_19138:638-1615(-)
MPTIRAGPVRLNGFTLPLHPLQVTTWVLMLILTVTFYTLVVPPLGRTLQICSVLVYTLSLISTCFFGFLCTRSNPSDPTIDEERQCRLACKPFEGSKYPKLCRICGTHVLGKSKHCGQCNRCVNDFDHHCKWLNNCIGGRNYSLFCGCIASLEGLALIQTAAGCFIIGSILNKDEVYDAAKELFFVDGNGVAYVTVILVTSFLAFVILVFNGHLIIFHVWLYNKGMTTYDYIVFKRQRKQKVVRPQLPQSSDVHDETIDNTFSRMAIISGAPPKHLELVFNYKERPVSRVQSLSDSFQKQEMKHHSSVESEESKLGEEVNYGNSV